MFVHRQLVLAAGVLLSSSIALAAGDDPPAADPAPVEVAPADAEGAPAQPARPSIAVMDFKFTGMSDADVELVRAALTSVVTAEIAKLGLRVVSQADIAAMLSFEEMKVALACDEGPSCLAEIGGAIGTDLLLSGTVSKLGGVFNLSMTLMDIESARVQQRFTGTAGSVDVLPDAARRGVAVLFQRSADLAGTGTLFVKTEPPGARVFLNGRDVGVSPLTIDEVPAGDHEISATKGGLSVKKRVLVEPRGLAKLLLDLATTPPVALKILSTPAEAAVLLDGQPVGETPLILDEVAAGEHRLSVRLRGYETETRDLTLSYEEWDRGGRAPLKVELELVLEKMPLAIDGLVEGASVLVDGAATTERPLLVPGKHRVEVRAPGYQPVSADVVVAPAQPASLRVEMKHTEDYDAYLTASSVHGVVLWGAVATAGVTALAGVAGAGGAYALSLGAASAYQGYLAASDPVEIESAYGQVTELVTAAQALELASYVALATAGLATTVAVGAAFLAPEDPREQE